MPPTKNQAEIGKKVFILNPPSVFEEELLHEVLKREYEIYLLRDTGHALRVFAKYPDSIVFINIDSGPKEEQWEAYIRRLIGDSKYEGLKVGILSYNPSSELTRKYLMEVGIQCGFIKLSLGAQESAKIITRVLDANEARGRRRYVRARCEKAPNTGYNLEYDGQKSEGPILDISSVGAAIRLPPGRSISAKSLIRNVQLRLRSKLVLLDAAVLGSRSDDKSIHVLLFRGEEVEKQKRQIRHFIHKSLQSEIEKI